MNEIELQELVGGALQEKFQKSFKRVIDNLQDVNTSYKQKRKITITLNFAQNERRNDVSCEVSVVEKLAPQAPMETSFAIGKDLKTGETYAEEYGAQIRGQMSIDDYTPTQVVGDKVVDTDTGEIMENTVVDFRKAAEN